VEERSAAAMFCLGSLICVYPLFAILEGEAAIPDAAVTTIVRHTASGFLGEMNLISDQTVCLTALVTQPMRYVAVDRDELRPLSFENGPAGGSAVVDLVARREAVKQHNGGGRQRVGGERA